MVGERVIRRKRLMVPLLLVFPTGQFNEIFGPVDIIPKPAVRDALELVGREKGKHVLGHAAKHS